MRESVVRVVSPQGRTNTYPPTDTHPTSRNSTRGHTRYGYGGEAKGKLKAAPVKLNLI